MMKRGLKLLLSVILFGAFLMMPVEALAEPVLKVEVNGEVLSFEKPLVLEKGRTLVPLNGVFEKINAEVTYDKEQNKVLIEDQYTTVEMIVGDVNALVHKKYDFSGIPLKVTLDVPAKLIDGEVYLPLRFVAESLGALVSWDGKNFMAVVKTVGEILPAETPADYIIVHEADIKHITELAQWYEENYKTKGIHSFKTEKDTYVLVSAGVRPTGGYGLEIRSATIVSPGSLYLTARVIRPDPGDDVTMALTYPNLLLRFENQVFEIVDGEVQD